MTFLGFDGRLGSDYEKQRMHGNWARNKASKRFRRDGKIYWDWPLDMHGEHTRASMGWLDS